MHYDYFIRIYWSRLNVFILDSLLSNLFNSSLCQTPTCFCEDNLIPIMMVISKNWISLLNSLFFSSKWDWLSYIISIAKTASKKIGALICFVKFLSPVVARYLYKSTIRPCMECCYYVWAGACSCYLELLDKLQNEYAGLLVIHFLPLSNLWLIVEMYPA